MRRNDALGFAGPLIYHRRRRGTSAGRIGPAKPQGLRLTPLARSGYFFSAGAGMISRALIRGFSTCAVKVMSSEPSVTSTSTVST
jgi:hypothetical protein